MEQKTHKGGRRKGSGRYGVKVFGYFSDEEKQALEALSERWRCTLAEALRRTVREEARRAGLLADDH